MLTPRNRSISALEKSHLRVHRIRDVTAERDTVTARFSTVSGKFRLRDMSQKLINKASISPFLHQGVIFIGFYTKITEQIQIIVSHPAEKNQHDMKGIFFAICIHTARWIQYLLVIT